MWIGRFYYKTRRKFHEFLNRTLASSRQARHKTLSERRSSEQSGPVPGLETKIIWSTLVTSKRRDELEIAQANLENLKPVLSWSSLTVDGTANDIGSFIKEDYRGGFDNVIWLTQPHIVSRKGHYAGKMGHYNRISLNFLRGWICNLERGEEKEAYLFCHTDGDWKITVRPESIEPLCRFFHERPEVVALSRPLDPGLTGNPKMWPDRTLGKNLWLGKYLLSTNVILAPVERIKPLVLEALRVFPEHRPDLLEDVLGKLASKHDLITAYPSEDYYRTHFHIDLEETRKPYAKTGLE